MSAGTRIPNPFITAITTNATGQWHRGEPVDDNTLHQRVDVQLNLLQGYATDNASDFQAFFGNLATSQVMTPSTQPVAWAPVIDTHSGWDSTAHKLTIANDGLYLITAQVLQGSSSTIAMSIGVGSSVTTGVFFGPASGDYANRGPVVTYAGMYAAGDLVWIYHDGNFSARSAASCWCFIQQVANTT